MQNIQALQKKIQAAENLQSIVSTMKAFASSNIHQFQQAAESSLAYRQVLDMALYITLSQAEMKDSPRRAPGKTIHMVFGSDHGLAGRFNEKITTFARDEIPRDPQHLVLAVGHQISPRLEPGLKIKETFTTPQTEHGITSLVQTLLVAIERLREEETAESVILYYNKPAAAAAFVEEKETLLPIDLSQLSRSIPRWESRSIPTTYSPIETLLSDLIQQYIFITLYRTFAYSLAAENASRLASMQTAEKNIEERLSELSSAYRRQRQNNITEEITDITAGFRAIKKALSP